MLRENGVRSFQSDEFSVEFTDRAFIEKPIADFVETQSANYDILKDDDETKFWSV